MLDLLRGAGARNWQATPPVLLERAVRDVLQVAARVDHPRSSRSSVGPTWPGVNADYLAAGFNTFQGTWLGSGGPSQLELVVIDWIRQWVGFPETGGGLFTSGGSAAILDALVAAREQAGAPDRPAIFLSDQSHSAVERAARIIGVRREGIVVIPSDSDYRLPPEALVRAIAKANKTASTLLQLRQCRHANTGAVDPLRCRPFARGSDSRMSCGIWRFRRICEEASAARGHERADSSALMPTSGFSSRSRRAACWCGTSRRSCAHSA
jgi:hypothetical protein